MENAKKKIMGSNIGGIYIYVKRKKETELRGVRREESTAE